MINEDCNSVMVRGNEQSIASVHREHIVASGAECHLVDKTSSGVPLQHTRGCCDPVLQDEQLMAALVEFVLKAQLEALEEKDASCVSNHCGVRSHQLRAIYGTSRLNELNWIREDVCGQVRFKNTVDYPVPVRLICCSGRKISGAYQVFPKGTNTRNATKENQPWLGQRSFAFAEDESSGAVDKDTELVQNYWVYVDSAPLHTGGWWVTISVGLAHSLSESGRIMETAEDRIIFDSNVNFGVDDIGVLLPPVEHVDIDIDEQTVDGAVSAE